MTKFIDLGQQVLTKNQIINLQDLQETLILNLSNAVTTPEVLQALASLAPKVHSIILNNLSRFSCDTEDSQLAIKNISTMKNLQILDLSDLYLKNPAMIAILTQAPKSLRLILKNTGLSQDEIQAITNRTPIEKSHQLKAPRSKHNIFAAENQPKPDAAIESKNFKP